MTPVPGPNSCVSSKLALVADHMPELVHNRAMSPSRNKDAKALLLEFRERAVVSPSLPAREDWLARIDTILKALEVQTAQIGRLRQDVEEAEHNRDAANLARMRVFGQLNTLHKTLAAATPNFAGDSDGEAQHVAQRRIQWLVESGGTDPAIAQAARKAEMEAPMPGQAVDTPQRVVMDSQFPAVSSQFASGNGGVNEAGGPVPFNSTAKTVVPSGLHAEYATW